MGVQPILSKSLMGGQYGGLAYILDGRPASLDNCPAPLEKVRRAACPAYSYARIMLQGRKDRGGHEEEARAYPAVTHGEITCW